MSDLRKNFKYEKKKKTWTWINPSQDEDRIKGQPQYMNGWSEKLVAVHGQKETGKR